MIHENHNETSTHLQAAVCSPQAVDDVLSSVAEIQRRAAGPIAGGQDVIVQSQTGSGKTLSFVMPLLARLQYPPALYPEDLKVLPAAIAV